MIPSGGRLLLGVALGASLLALLGLIRAEREAEPIRAPADVRAAGAVGDGQADDTAAIQRAINAGVGRFPRGTYKLTRSIVIDLDKVGPVSLSGDGTARIVMAGAGPAFHFIGTHMKGTADPKSFQPNVWERQRSPMIDGLEIVGTHPEAVGIRAVGTMQLTLTRLVIRKALHAVHLVERNRNVIVSDCHFYENAGIGLYLDDVDLHQINVVGSHISYNAGGGIVSRKGNVRNLHVGTCDIESNMTKEGPPTANVLIDCSDSVLGTAEVAITGCTIQHNQSPGSANIRYIGRSKASKTQPVVREGHVTITGNVLSDVQDNISLKDVRGATLTGNTFWMAFTHNLIAEDCTHLVVGPNNLDRNPRYDYGNSKEAKNGVVFRNCEDCTLTGLHLAGVRQEPAALVLDHCRRLHLTGCTILDCDGVGLLVKTCTDCTLSNTVIRDDRAERKPAPSLRVIGGRGNEFSNLRLGNGEDRARH